LPIRSDRHAEYRLQPVNVLVGDGVGLADGVGVALDEPAVAGEVIDAARGWAIDVGAGGTGVATLDTADPALEVAVA
jgi:Ethanolamine utilization protein EutJ (predicted chaperonin)